MADDERTPVWAHPRPSPVVVRAGDAPPQPPPLPHRRASTPQGGTLGPLGRREHVPDPEAFKDEEPTSPRATQHVVNRLVRNYLACTPEDQRLIEALAIRLRPGVHG